MQNYCESFAGNKSLKSRSAENQSDSGTFMKALVRWPIVSKLEMSVAILAQDRFGSFFCSRNCDYNTHSHGVVVFSTELECWQCTGLVRLVDGAAMVAVWYLFRVNR